MAVGFGFSLGDFIAALELVGTVIDALRDSGSASAEYRELLRVLYGLETALIQVKRLEVDESQRAELIALQQAAAQCQRTIDDFWNKIRKYQPHLGSSSECSDFHIRTAWTKIKWAVCKRDDLARFKADLVGHTESIQILLAVIQMQQVTLQRTEQDKSQRALLGCIQDCYQSSMQRLSAITDGMARSLLPEFCLIYQTDPDSTVLRGKQLLELMVQTARVNVQVFAIVLDVQNILKHIPGQVQRQQPVFMIDAVGKHSPFHLEFIRSAAALTAVLRCNLSNFGRATRKIDRGEFVIQDAATKRDIDLAQDWELCFRPGQHVDMSMIFDRPDDSAVGYTNCPHCKFFYYSAGDAEIEWGKCGLVFQRIRLTDGNEPAERTTSECQNPKLGSEIARSVNTKPDNTNKDNDEENDEENDEALGVFKRIRLRVSSPGTGTDGTWQYRNPAYLNRPGRDSIANHVEYLKSDSVPSPYGHASDEAPDTLLLRYKHHLYELNFKPYAIRDGIMLVRDVRIYAAEKLKLDPRRLLMLYKGRPLKDDYMTAKDCEFKQDSVLMCRISDRGIGGKTEAEDDGYEADDGQTTGRARWRARQQHNERSGR